MGVAQNIRPGFGVGLPVPKTNFEKLGPMWKIVLEGRIAGSALPQTMHDAASLRSSKY